MADIFVSQLLVLFLLAIPLIRPFSSFLQKMPAISILPIFALILSVIIIFGQGLYISILPVLLFTIIVMFSEIRRFLRFCAKLDNGDYNIWQIVLRVVLIVLLIGTIYSVGKFAPENIYTVNQSTEITDVVLNKDFGNKAFGKLVKPTMQSADENSTEPYDSHYDSIEKKPTILILGNFTHSNMNTNTISRFFINEGYTVLSISDFGSKRPVYEPPNTMQFWATLKYAISKNDFYNFHQVANSDESTENFNRFMDAIIAKYAEWQTIFVFSEGVYNRHISQYLFQHPDKITNLFIYSNPNEELSYLPNNWYTVINTDNEIAVTTESIGKPICVFQPKTENGMRNLAGFAELQGDDPLGATLLQSSRDVGRSNRIKIAEAFKKWIEVKETL